MRRVLLDVFLSQNDRNIYVGPHMGQVAWQQTEMMMI